MNAKNLRVPLPLNITFTYAAFKGIFIGISALAIVSSGLPEFIKAILIAFLSGLLGIIGMIVSAYISSRSSIDALKRHHELAQQIKLLTDQNQKLLADLARAQGITKRTDDPK